MFVWVASCELKLGEWYVCVWPCLDAVLAIQGCNSDWGCNIVVRIIVFINNIRNRPHKDLSGGCGAQLASRSTPGHCCNGVTPLPSQANWVLVFRGECQCLCQQNDEQHLHTSP